MRPIKQRKRQSARKREQRCMIQHSSSEKSVKILVSWWREEGEKKGRIEKEGEREGGW